MSRADEPSGEARRRSRDDLDRYPVGGPLARMAEKLFGGNERLSAFADAQRVERLRSCVDLERALVDCRRLRERMLEAQRTGGDPTDVRDNEGGKDLDKRANMQESRGGRKIIRYFGWTAEDAYGRKEEELQSVDTAPPTGNDQLDDATSLTFGTDSEVSNVPFDGASKRLPPVPSCSRETHAVWACRALAVGCGDRLVPLRDCFLQAEEEVMARAVEKVKGSSDGDGWDGKAVVPKVSCADEQRALSACVMQKEAKLEKRVKEREAREMNA